MSVAGLDPRNRDVVLTDGADFIYALRCRVAGVVTDWPVGTHWYITFDGVPNAEWEASVVGPLASWNVDKVVTAEVPGLTAVRWRYVNGSTDLVYWMGRVRRNRG